MLAFYRNLAKLTRTASKLAGKKGTDLPGKVLRKVNDNVLTKLASDFDEIVFVTGTNGKTTTSNLIGHTLRSAGENFINNFEGANMLDGIISTFAIQGRNNTKLAIIEIDEGSIKRVMKYITPTKFVSIISLEIKLIDLEKLILLLQQLENNLKVKKSS